MPVSASLPSPPAARAPMSNLDVPRPGELSRSADPLPARAGRLRTKYHHFMSRLAAKSAERYWKEHPPMEAQRTQSWLHERMVKGEPTAVGRMGQVEATIAMWAHGITRPFPFPLPGGLSTDYGETVSGMTNAGVRPRNAASYRAFADLLLASFDALDLVGVWSKDWEMAILHRLGQYQRRINVELLSTSFEFTPHWFDALDGKRVLVVSPFTESIQRQHDRLPQVWPKRKALPQFTIVPYQFPYLVEDDTPLTWWEVYADASKVIDRGDYDVALLGCGGLGSPLAARAKEAGKIGLHLGGHLQLIFGVYGSRIQDQDWHARWVNDAWVRPLPQEVPRCAQRIEKGCYW